MVSTLALTVLSAGINPDTVKRAEKVSTLWMLVNHTNQKIIEVNMRGHNLSLGISIVSRQMRNEFEELVDIGTFHAPSECYDAAKRGFHRERRLVRRRVKALTGLKWREFIKEIESRTSTKWFYKFCGIDG